MLSVKCGPAVFFFVSFLSILSNCSGEENLSTASPTAEGEPWELIADPPKLERITELEPNHMNLSLTYKGSETPPFVTNETIFLVQISMSNSLTVVLNTYEIEFTWEDIVDGNNKTLQVTGQVIGYVDLNFVMDIIPKPGSIPVKNDIPVLSNYLITVVRASGKSKRFKKTKLNILF